MFKLLVILYIIRYLLQFKTFAQNKIKKQINPFFFTPSYEIRFVFNLGLLCYNRVKSSSMCLQLCNQKNSSIKKFMRSLNSKCHTVFSGFFFFKIYSLSVLILRKNTGPKHSSLRFCLWNVNGLTAHDCIKITLIQAYITDQNFDIVCLSET